ncbi:UvrD-helicase domain-containing protein [Dankookia sp. P2]|uniref:UvrD-helicase domain-containing protein n=1 Tax=Dankookia sp. P2 TaxID=3423955 RepID=UPI003D672328
MLTSFAFADSFLERVQSLPNEAKKLVLRKTAEFAATPDASGFNAEALSGVARQNGWHSARVDRDLRLIWTRIEATIVFAWVDRHDDAYAWADRNRLRVNPRTGSAQRYVAPETVVTPPQRTEAATAVAEPKAPTDRPAQEPPFSGEDDEYLLGLGVPEEWVGQVKSLAAVADLDGLIGLLPDEAWERLVDLANGRRPAVSASATIPDLVDPLRHPDSKRRFMLLSDDAALDRVLAGDWDAWQVFLHPSQRAAVETRHRGPSLVSGAAGTGKSVVAVHRAAFLARRNPEARILLTSYSKTLSVRLAQQLDRLLRGDAAARGRIEVAHLDRRLMDFARLRLGPVNIAGRSHIQPLLDRAASRSETGAKRSGLSLGGVGNGNRCVGH